MSLPLNFVDGELNGRGRKVRNALGILESVAMLGLPREKSISNRPA
jgi:hypothetical protein